MMGQSSAFFIGPSIRVVDSATAVRTAAALDIQIGNSAKSGWAPSVSQQIATLRNSFIEANKTASATSPVYQVILGQLPLVVWTDSADHMSSIMRMIGDLSFTSVKLIFGGASESWLVASELKRFNASVILYRCAPNGYENRRCAYKTILAEMKKHGIRVRTSLKLSC
jgi:precorrin-6x reductase